MSNEKKNRWDKENTTFIGLKLNNKTDADILKMLEGKPKQTFIKKWIRAGMEREQP